MADKNLELLQEAHASLMSISAIQMSLVDAGSRHELNKLENLLHQAQKLAFKISNEADKSSLEQPR